MFDFKLQVGCLAILAVFIVGYARETRDKTVPVSKIYNWLLHIGPWAIVFDGATAWTVNHMDVVPGTVNDILHALFFVFMNIVSVIILIYFVDQTTGIRSKKSIFALLLPCVISIIIILCTMGDLDYLHGKTTNYSMGAAAITCFVTVFIYFLVTVAIIIKKHRTIEKRKQISILLIMLVSVAILLVQILNPEILISCLLPTIAIIGFYITFEDPSVRKLKIYNDNMVTCFATLVENRDNNTGGHIKRTKGYVTILLNEMSHMSEYRNVISKDYIENVKKAAPMHDIGKIAIPDAILQKPGKLTEEEFEVMKMHSAIGADMIKDTFSDLDDDEYQQIAYEVARYHHEKWNGKGYPEGLSGEDIPLHARIMSIADVFDAVSVKRCYRDALPLDQCFKIIEEGAGDDFDPVLVATFLRVRDKIEDYYEREKDT